jgi:linoleate 10R-lipoxygenase
MFNSPKKKEAYSFQSKLMESGRPLEELLGNIMGVAVGACVTFSQAAVHVIDFYLDAAQEKHRAELARLATSNDPSSDNLIRGYVREAMRKSFSALTL